MPYNPYMGMPMMNGMGNPYNQFPYSHLNTYPMMPMGIPQYSYPIPVVQSSAPTVVYK